MRKGGIVLSIGSSGGIVNDDYFAKDIDLYPNRLASYIRTKYGAVQLINKCIPSTTSADMLFNRHWWGNIRADIVTVKLGSNDAANSRSTPWTPYSAGTSTSVKGAYTAGINTGAINTPVTGTQSGFTVTLLVGTATSLGITVGMQVTGVGIGINPLTGASAQVTEISGSTVTLSIANTVHISSNSSTPSYVTFSTGEDVMPADIVTINSLKNIQTGTLYVKSASYICNTSHNAKSNLSETSSSTVQFGTGSKTWVVSNVLDYAVGDTIRFYSGSSYNSNYMEGNITGISGSSITVNVTSYDGSTSSSPSSWNFGGYYPSDYTNWTLASVAFQLSDWVTAVGSSSIPTHLGTWSGSGSGIAYKKISTTKPPSIVIYRPDYKSEFKAYYCIQNHTSSVSITPSDPVYWREVQSNLYEFSRRLVVNKVVNATDTQTELPHVPTIAYEQNLIEIIAQLRSRNPYVKIILCCPYWVSSSYSRRQNFKQYYNSLDNVSKATTTTNSLVVVSHLNNAWESSNYGTYVGDDGLHPSTAGHKRIFNFTSVEGQALFASISTGTSSSSVSVGTGSKTWSVSTPLGYEIGDTVLFYRTSASNIYMEGTVTAASSSSISATITSYGGTLGSSYSDWSFTNPNLNSNFFYQVLDTQYGGLKSIVDGNPSWFVNWIDI